MHRDLVGWFETQVSAPVLLLDTEGDRLAIHSRK